MFQSLPQPMAHCLSSKKGSRSVFMLGVAFVRVVSEDEVYPASARPADDGYRALSILPPRTIWTGRLVSTAVPPLRQLPSARAARQTPCRPLPMASPCKPGSLGPATRCSCIKSICASESMALMSVWRHPPTFSVIMVCACVDPRWKVLCTLYLLRWCARLSPNRRSCCVFAVRIPLP